MAVWNSQQYLKFKNERTQPSIDLAARIALTQAEKILDIGCGPGNSTRVVKNRFPDARVLGVDSSENMIEKARQENPDMEFAICDASREFDLGNDFDIVFSNACIQWLPDHDILIPRMMGLLKKGGVLAVQIPVNFDEPIHKVIKSVTGSEKWSGKFADKKTYDYLSAEKYFDILSDCSSDFEIWQTTYMHRLSSHEAIMEWYRGTGLLPYLSQLSDGDKADFEKDIFKGVAESYPVQKNGQVIFRFPRLFFVAVK